MHELNVVLEIELPRFEGLFLVLDCVLELGGLLFLYVDVHLRQIDLFLFLEELVDRLFFLYVIQPLPFRSALTRNRFSLLFP
jgi:hypothetical protein